MNIACLHTAQSNVAIFEEAACALGIPLSAFRHLVRADLLLAAEVAGGMNDAIAAETTALLMDLSGRADLVLLTCSTLGLAAGQAQAQATVPIVRVDQALARQAVKAGGHVVVLCAVATTVAPTRNLFEEAATSTGARVDVRLVPHAWDQFRAGDVGGYVTLVAQAADSAYLEGAKVVALAQASMTNAAMMVTGDVRPLTSPYAALSMMKHYFAT